MVIVQMPQQVYLQTEKMVQQNSQVAVQLPPMFVLFLSGAPEINMNYEAVRKEAEAMMCTECAFDERSRKILTKTDFSYFVSVAAPDAGPEELRTLCDWGNWVFPFDDQFDNGRLKDDPEGAQTLVDDLLAPVFNENDPKAWQSDDPLVQFHTTVWERIFKSSPPGVRRRFAKTMRDYCNGSVEQVRNCSKGFSPSLEEMLALRRQSSGVSPLYALVEYAHKLHLPDSVFETRSIKEIERIGIDLVLLQNDILSYCKEEKEGVTHNMVAICRRSGMPAQMAFNHVGDMLISRYRDWYLALAELPSWGERVDYEVQEYIRGVKNVVKANLNWSFHSGRYFGKAHEVVRKTWTVTVKPQNPDLKVSIM